MQLSWGFICSRPGLITRKVGVSVNAQEGLYSMLDTFIAIGLSEPFLGAGIQQIAYIGTGIRL